MHEEVKRPLWPSRAYVSFLRDWLPGVRTEMLQISKEATQTTVWMVTLASALLTFLAVNPNAFKGLDESNARWLLGLLMLAVLLGVLQRVVQLMSFRLTTPHELELHLILSVGTTPTDQPREPDTFDSRDEIIEELKRFWELDYSWMRDRDAEMDFCRNCYQTLYDYWKKGERERYQAIGRVFAAYLGKSVEWGEKFGTDWSCPDFMDT